MGMPIFDNLDLEAVSAEANKRQRWEFLITAAPLAVTGGTGSPFNPIATFWTASMMLEHLGEPKAAIRMMAPRSWPR